jgi:glycosyltransferase involved in cell wall biosynthesis
MRILMVSWEYPPHIVGGLGRHVHYLSKTLSARGVQVTVLTFTDGTSPASETVGGVKVLRVNPYGARYPDFVSWIHGLNMRMVERAKEVGDYDLVHVHDWLSAYTGIALKHMRRKPLVATIHSTEMGRRGGLRNEYERHIHEMEWWLSYEAWNVICCSNYMQREVSSNLNCPVGKMAVIPNGFAKSEVQPSTELTRRDYAQDQEKIVLYVGRLVYEKGPQLLLEASSKLRDLCLKFIFVGDGAMRSYLIDLSKRLGVSERTYFLGYVSDAQLWAFYKWSSMAVFPSIYEPFGIVALEAMGAGVPAIVSATGGLDEIVQDGFNGLKFTAGSSDSLAYQIRRIYGDDNLVRRVVGNAKSTLDKYSWDEAAESTLGIYRRVLGEYAKGNWKPSI